MSQTYDINSITEELKNETELPILNFREEAYDNVAYAHRIVTHKVNEEIGTVTIVFVPGGNFEDIPLGKERYDIVQILLYQYTITDKGPLIWKSKTIAENLESEEAMHQLLHMQFN